MRSGKEESYRCLFPGMMLLFWVMLWSVLLPRALFSGPDHCMVLNNGLLHDESPVLRSLRCYNDYSSYVQCEWTEHKNSKLQLWFHRDDGREQCLPSSAAAQDGADEKRTVQCTYKTLTFSIGIKHTVYFLHNSTAPLLCSSASKRPLVLSQQLRAQPPVNLSTHGADDGGQQFSWSSPYPSSSSLNKNITYQFSYRNDTQDSWETDVVTNTSMRIEKQSMLSGFKYEARVRARVSVGQWSHWSPVVTWKVKEAPGAWRSPSLHCVLVGEKEVMCSWEVSTDMAHLIIYQMVCRHNSTALSTRCCDNPTVKSRNSRTVLKYSCLLNVTDPAHLQVELLPAHNAKEFGASRHIRPPPPKHVTVTKKGSNWIVEWAKPSTTQDIQLCYELCYYRIQDKEYSFQNTSVDVTSKIILHTLLEPSQDYQVKVRSFLYPGDKRQSAYSGIPSQWSDPVGWTSDEVTLDPSNLIYLATIAFVTIVFFILYCTIPACRRRVILWVDSVPSPGKSKILSEVKSPTWALMQSEKTSVCKVQHMDSISTCFSDTLLWPDSSSESKSVEQDEYCWKCDNNPSPTEEDRSFGLSSLSFSGPYITCQVDPKCESVNINSDEKTRETLPDDPESSPSVNFSLYGKGYVCLPNRSTSRSTQDLLSHSSGNTNTPRHDRSEQDQQNADSAQWSAQADIKPRCDEPTGSCQPPALTSGPSTGWPQGGTLQASGYFHLPAF